MNSWTQLHWERMGDWNQYQWPEKARGLASWIHCSLKSFPKIEFIWMSMDSWPNPSSYPSQPVLLILRERQRWRVEVDKFSRFRTFVQQDIAVRAKRIHLNYWSYLEIVHNTAISLGGLNPRGSFRESGKTHTYTYINSHTIRSAVG